MTIAEQSFYDEIQRVRGVIKNNKKYEPIVCDILKYGTRNWITECTLRKRYGLGFIWDVVTSLAVKEQEELYLYVITNPMINIDLAKSKLKELKGL